MDEQFDKEIKKIEAQVAEKIMGYNIAKHTEHDWEEKMPGVLWCRRCWFTNAGDVDPPPVCLYLPEPFARSWYAIGEVIERMLELGFRNLSLLQNPNRTDGKHWTFVISAPEGRKAWKADGVLPGEAVCRASLMAIEEWNGQVAA